MKRKKVKQTSLTIVKQPKPLLKFARYCIFTTSSFDIYFLSPLKKLYFLIFYFFEEKPLTYKCNNLKRDKKVIFIKAVVINTWIPYFPNDPKEKMKKKQSSKVEWMIKTTSSSCLLLVSPSLRHSSSFWSIPLSSIHKNYPLRNQIREN